jgi:transposase
MMGERQVDQGSLFYEFSLERHVPADHLLRAIDCFVDLGDLRARLAAFSSSMGRPSIDPELLIRMLLIGHCHGIRPERRLREEVHLNLAYRWLCRLGLDGEVPDHSTFSKNRHGRFRDSDLMRHLLETVLRRCIAEGLVGGEGFAVDASLIKAEASRQKGVEGSKGLPPEMTSRAIEEYIAVLDEAAFGAATEVTPKFISPADPAARWTGAHGGQAFFAYSNNYLIGLDHAIIVDVEASTAVRQAEVTAAKTMIGRVDERLGASGGRLGLRVRGDARLAGARAWHRASHPGLRQIRAGQRHLLTRRLYLRPRSRRLSMPGRQDADHHGNDCERQPAPISGQQIRLSRLRLEAALLSQGTSAQGAAQHS